MKTHAALLVSILCALYLPLIDAQRMVFCHYMLWVPSTADSVQGFVTDIQKARSYGIDAFAINTAQWYTASWPQPTLSMMVQAAEQEGFKFFMSVDMTNEFQSNPQAIVDMVSSVATSSAYLHVNGGAYLSTFVGDAVGWEWESSVLSPLVEKIGSVYFVPFFNGDPTQIIEQHPYVNGLFHWTAWPFDSDLQTVDPTVDKQFRAATSSAGKQFMAPVSPYFVKHYCGLPANQMPNWVFGDYAGFYLYVAHWEQLIQIAPDFIEILTWNDYPEGTYIGPVTAPWGMTNPCNGGQTSYDRTAYPHDAYGTLSNYFIQAYKNGGNYPNATYDQVFAFYRRFPESEQCNDPTGLGPIQNAGSMSDDVYIITLFKEPATITIFTGSSSSEFNANSGLGTWNVPWNLGSQSVTVTRNGQVIQQHTWAAPITDTCTDGNLYDMNTYTENIAF